MPSAVLRSADTFRKLALNQSTNADRIIKESGVVQSDSVREAILTISNDPFLFAVVPTCQTHNAIKIRGMMLTVARPKRFRRGSVLAGAFASIESAARG